MKHALVRNSVARSNPMPIFIQSCALFRQIVDGDLPGGSLMSITSNGIPTRRSLAQIAPHEAIGSEATEISRVVPRSPLTIAEAYGVLCHGLVSLGSAGRRMDHAVTAGCS